jgi:transaldolase
VSASDIQQAGLAVSKRAYQIYKAENYEAVLLVAALRGTYHMTELAGGELIMSIHPRYQEILLGPGVPREARIGLPIKSEVIDRLSAMPEFVRSYEPEGMKPQEFISFGAAQKTLSQFDQVGWAMLEAFDAF